MVCLTLTNEAESSKGPVLDRPLVIPIPDSLPHGFTPPFHACGAPDIGRWCVLDAVNRQASRFMDDEWAARRLALDWNLRRREIRPNTRPAPNETLKGLLKRSVLKR